MSHKITMYENLRDMLDTELKNYEKKNEFSSKDDLDTVYKLVTSVERLDKILDKCYEMKCIEEGEEFEGESNAYGYSSRRGVKGSGRMSYRGSYDSYRGGRGSYAAYPSMHMMNDDPMMYSRDDSKQKMIHKLSTLMDDTMSDKDRLAIKECINKINMS